MSSLKSYQSYAVDDVEPIIGEIVNTIAGISPDMSNYDVSKDIIEWTIDAISTVTSLNGLVYGGGVYVAVADAGLIVTSTDAINWTSRTSGTASTINAVTYENTNGLYLYGDTAGNVGTSTNAINWTIQTPFAAQPARSLGYGNGIYLLGGDAGKLATSTNAINWTARTTPFVNNIYSLVYGEGDGLYVIVGKDGGEIATSTDAISWTSRTSGHAAAINVVKYENGLYIAGGGDGGTPAEYSLVSTSTNAINWNTISLGYNEAIETLAYGDGLYVAFMGSNTVGAGFSTSTDGINWWNANLRGTNWNTQAYGPTRVNALIYANSKFTFMGQGGLVGNSIRIESRVIQNYEKIRKITKTYPNTYLGSDIQTSGTASTIFALTYGDGLYAYGGNGGVLATSTNAVNWAASTSGTASAINALAYGNGLYVYATSGGGLSTSTNAINWTARTSGTATSLLSLTYGNGLYVYGGDVGVGVATSTNAINWTARTIPDNTRATNTLVYGNGLYLLGASGGVLATSTNAINWTAQTSGTASPIRTIIYGNSLYVYGTDNGGLSTSTDGITWTARTSGTTSDIRGITYNNGLYIYAAATGSTAVLGSSTNGINWTPRTVSRPQGLWAITYGNGLYVYAGTGGMLNTVLTSTTSQFDNGYNKRLDTNKPLGGTWELITSPDDGSTYSAYGMAYGDGTFVYVGYNQTYTVARVAAVRKSNYLDPLAAFGSTVYNDWTVGTPAHGNYELYAVAYGDGLFVYGGQGGVLATSTNGLDWTSRTSGTASSILRISYENGLYLYGGTGGRLATSTDAISWTAQTSGTASAIYAFTYGNGVYVYSGAGGRLATSTDAISWTAQTSGTASALLGLAYNNNLYVVGGASGVIRTSTNAINWTARTSNSFYDINDIIYGGGYFAYCGSFGGLGSSTDGINWDKRLTSLPYSDGTQDYDTRPYYALAYGDDMFMFGGFQGVHGVSKTYYNTSYADATSPGMVWNLRESGTIPLACGVLQSVAGIPGTYVTIGGSVGQLLSSTNAIDWTSRTSGSTSEMDYITYGNGLFVYVDHGGGAGRSTNGINWTRQASTPSNGFAIETITYGNGLYVLGYQSSPYTKSSTNAINWTTGTVTVGFGIPQALTYGNGLYVAVNSTGRVATSTNGINFTSDLGNRFTAVSGKGALAYGNGLFVAGNNTGDIFTSTNASDWTSRTSGTSLQIKSISYGNGVYVYAGESSGGGVTTLGASTDGINWTNLSSKYGYSYSGHGDGTNSLTNRGYRDVKWCGDKFVVVGLNGVMATSDAVRLQPGYRLDMSKDPLTEWISTPISSAAVFTGFAYGNGLYVAITDSTSYDQMVYTATDAINWTPLYQFNYLAGMGGLAEIIYADGLFVIASSTNGLVVRSTDGINWIRDAGNPISTVAGANGLTYGNGLYVIAGSSGIVETSTNAINWTDQTTGTASALAAVAYGLVGTTPTYVIAGLNRTLFSSTNAVNWTSRGAASGLAASDDFQDMIFGNGIFIGSTTAGSNKIILSADGITWSLVAGTGDSGPFATNNNGLFIQAGVSSIFTSTNGQNWTTGPSITRGSNPDAAYVNGKFLVSSSTGVIHSSQDLYYVPEHVKADSSIVKQKTYPELYAKVGLIADGLNTWTARTSGATSTLNALIYGPNGLNTVNYIAAGLGTVGILLRTSTNAINWTARTQANASAINSLVYASDQTTSKYVSAGNLGVLRTSTDGISWTARTSGTTSTIYALAYGSDQTNKYVYGTNAGGLSTSTNGINWTARTSGTASVINALIYGNSLYVYGTNAGGLSTSTNGINWTARTSGTSSTIYALAYGNSTYVYGTAAAGLSTSTNGINWTARTSPATGSIRGLTYNSTAGIFAYISDNGIIATSTNGISWASRINSTLTTDIAYALTNSPNLLVYAGQNSAGTVGIVGTAAPFSYDYATEFVVPDNTTYNSSYDKTSAYYDVYVKAA